MSRNLYYKEDLAKLKAERGPLSKTLTDTNKHRTRLVRAVKKAIHERGLTTFPDIVTLLHFEHDEIHKAINYLMRYDGLLLVNKRGEYPTYGYPEDDH